MINLHITLHSFLNASRVLKETESLVQSGLVKKIIIVALYENGLQEYEKIGYHRTVWRVKLESRNMPKLFIFQALKYFEFCLRVFFFSKKNNVDIVNVHSLSLLPLGVWLKIRHRAKLVYDTHELETETNGLTGFRKSVLKIVERALIRFADLTIVVGGEIEKWYKNKYGINSIVKILNCPRYQVTERSQLLQDEFHIPVKKKIVLYQGGLSAGRGIELLLDAFENSNDDRYVIIFMGNGPLAMAVRIAEGRCERIKYKPAVSASEVLKYTSSADIGIAVIDNFCLNHQYCLPNKIFEYIMAQLPVIVSNLPEMSKIVNTFHIGAVIQRRDGESIYHALHEIEELNQDELKKNLKNTANNFVWESQEEMMIRAYQTYIIEQ